MTPWQQPSDYAGFNPLGHLVVAATHRDASLLERVNWEVTCERLAKAAGEPGVPELPEGGWWSAPAPHETPALYQWDASHWAVGWVRYAMVRPDAPAAVLEEAKSIASDLAGYQVLDEDRWGTAEWEAMAAFWAGESIRGRLELVRDVNTRTPWASLSPFAARRAEPPESDQLEELLRSIVA